MIKEIETCKIYKEHEGKYVVFEEILIYDAIEVYNSYHERYELAPAVHDCYCVPLVMSDTEEEAWEYAEELNKEKSKSNRIDDDDYSFSTTRYGYCFIDSVEEEGEWLEIL